MPKQFRLILAIRGERALYKSSVIKRDKRARNILETASPKASPNKLKMGSLYLMEYFTPKTEEELEYYDAKPCVIFFGRTKTQDGKRRVVGFNIHYFPPRMRFRILDKVVEIFRPFYRKMWAIKDPQDLPYFDYYMLIYQLQKAKLDFGVRMYIPDLIGKCQLIEPKDWQKAVFTEGRFKKRTRDAIMKYWKNKLIDNQLLIRSKKRGYRKTSSQMNTQTKIK